MIVCNKCGGVIPEAAEEPKDAAKEPSGKYGNKKYQEEAPARRASLITLPCKRIVNGFDMNDVDLCDVCKAFLFKHINELQFRFINGLGEFEAPEMPGENHEGEDVENERV